MNTVQALLVSTAYSGVEPTKQTAYHGRSIANKFLSPPFGVYRVAFFTQDALRNRVHITTMDPMLEGADEICSFVRERKPALIGFSPVLALQGGDRWLMDQIHTAVTEIPGHDPLFVAGGIDATTTEHDLFDFFPWLHLIVSGYGEKVLPGILETRLEHPDISADALSQLCELLPGVRTRTSGCSTEHTPSITADEFHRYASYVGENIPYETYWEHNKGVNPDAKLDTPIEVVRVHTTSYCPFDCPFCAHQEYVKQIHGRQVFLLSPQDLLQLMIRLVRTTRARGIYFNDDEMFTGRARVAQFFNLVIEAKADDRLPNGLCFYGQTRVDTVDSELLKSAARAGFVYISFGVESFSEQALAADDLGKRFTANQAIKSVRESLEAIPITNVNLIIFHPSVTRESFIETVETVSDLLRYSLETGNRLSVNPFPTLEAYPQAPIKTVAEREKYPVQGRHVTDSRGGRVFVPESFLPLQKEFRPLVESRDGMDSRLLKKMQEVFARLKEDRRWPTHSVSRSIGVNGLAMFIAAYDLLQIDSDESEVSGNTMRELVFDLLRRFEMKPTQ